MMRIAIDISAITAPYLSGIGEYTLNLLENLLQIDRENQYILFYNSFKQIKVRKFDYENVKLIKLGYPNKILPLISYLFNYPKIDKLIETKVGQIDLYFLPRPNCFVFSKSVKKILLIHDLAFKIFPRFFTLKQRLFLLTVNLEKNINKYDWLIVISENTKRDIVEFLKYPADKISILYAGLNKIFRVIDDQKKLREIKNKYHLPEHFVFSLSNLEPRKNLMSLVLAFDQLLEENLDFKKQNLKLVIAGASAWSYQNLFKIHQQIKNSDSIIFLGYLPSEDRPFLYNLASAFVYPSFYEGFGLPPLEAMACACPVVASNNSSLPEVVGEAGLMIDPYNLNELKEAVRQILTDRHLKNSLIQKGLSRASKFDWRTSASQLLELFRKI